MTNDERRPASRLRVVIGISLMAGSLLTCSGSGVKNPAATPFDAFWSTFDREYPYFVYKDIDWDLAYEQFQPQAAEAETTAQLVSILLEMVAPLRDLHVWFQRPDGSSLRSYIPSTPPNWREDVWRSYVSAAGWQQLGADWGWASFSGVPYVFIGAWNSDGFSVSEFDALLEGLRDAPAMIIDVRANSGGSDGLAYGVAGRFADETRMTEHFQYRDGPEHDDFGPILDKSLQPRGSWQFLKPVLVLSGPSVFSSNESFIAAMRELPHVTVVGDTTGGASGNPGSYALADGWSYTVSRWIHYTADFQVIEWQGIPPDVDVPATAADFEVGSDPVLDYAIAWADGF